MEIIDGMSVFEQLFVSIYCSLHEMKENKCEPRFNNRTSAILDSLFQLVTEFSFIATLVITKNILDYLLQSLGNFKLKIQTYRNQFT